MKTQTMNMFAATNEDLPIISGFALTQAAEMPIDKLMAVLTQQEMDIYQIAADYGDRYGRTANRVEKAQSLLLQLVADGKVISRLDPTGDVYYRVCQ
jgi:hypothetical protein